MVIRILVNTLIFLALKIYISCGSGCSVESLNLENCGCALQYAVFIANNYFVVFAVQ